MPHVHVNGIDLYYERAGSGPPLLYCNGSFSTLATSRPMVEAYTARFDLVAHDQRGLGLTEIPPGPYTMADYAADALALLDEVGWGTCRLVGTSFGGMVAQEIAVTAPDRIERLALLCTSPGGAGGSSYPMHELRAMPAEERAARSVQLLDTRFDAEWLATHPTDRALLEAMSGRPLVAEGSEAARGEREQAEARRYHDVWDRLGRITCPTLVAAGRYDGIAPLANSEAIAGRVRRSELRVYDGGHAFFAQDRTALPEIFDFLAA